MASQFVKLAEKVLKETETPMRVVNIWSFACQKSYEQDLDTKGKTPIASLSAQIYVDIKNNPDDTKFVKLDKGLFGLKEHLDKQAYQDYLSIDSDADCLNDSDSIQRDTILEKEMHAPLVNYLARDEVYSKTIDATRVTQKQPAGMMKWGTPDIVGVSFRKDLRKEVRAFCETASIPTVDIYAYELKRELTYSSLTKYFFQAVSNSTWANEAWLVYKDCEALENKDPMFEEELSRLNQAFGVGILKLDIDNIHDSKIIFPAIKQNNLNLTTLNKLCANADFEDFLKSVTEIIATDYGSREAIINHCIARGRFDKIEVDN